MKITSVEVICLQNKLSSSMVISRGGFQVRNHTLVKVTTDEGITGLGEGIGNAKLVAAILNAQMCNQVIGLDPFNIEFIRSKLIDSEVYFERKGSAICAASAIEMACWDIKGKKLGVPVYQLLGGRYQDRLKAYASDIYWEEDPIKMAKNAERIVDAGFKVVKAHIGYKSPAEDLIRVKRIREAIGENIGLMIDLNGGYSAFDACHAARLWETYNLTWLEEPINPNHLDALKDLRSKISIPIAAGENEFRIFGFKDLFENKAVDIAMPDIGRVGGLQETKNICVLADAYGIQVSPHNFSSGVLLAATLHLMASTPNTTLLEVDTSKNAVYQELLVEPLEFNDGYFTVPEGPGLGVEISPEILKKYQVTSF